MKNKILLFLGMFFFLLNIQSKAQKFAYINSEYILSNIPDYKAAQTQLDQLSTQWQREVEARYAEIEKLYKAFQAEQILLSDEMKKKREDDIVQKEKEVKDYQKQKFGFEGELFKKRQELVKPIQDKIYAAVKKYAEDNTFSVIFDKSSDLIMLYSSAKLDKSDDILKALGFGPGTPKTTKTPKK
jgi:outer membrane protein